MFGYPRAEWEEPLKSELLAAGSPRRTSRSRGVAEDPEGVGPRLFFHHAAEREVGPQPASPRHQRHPGRQPSREELEAEKDRIVALGAEVVRLVDQSWGPWPELYYQLRDPEGNEFCLQ